MSTELPGVTEVPAGRAGRTRPGPAEYWVDGADVTFPTMRPALPEASGRPAAWVRPTSDGTRTLAGPDETVRVTADALVDLGARGRDWC